MSQVSLSARELNQLVADIRRRPVKAGPYPFRRLGALARQVHGGGCQTDVNTLVTNDTGSLTFSRGLVARLLSGVRLAPDRHAGRVDAIAIQHLDRIRKREAAMNPPRVRKTRRWTTKYRNINIT